MQFKKDKDSKVISNICLNLRGVIFKKLKKIDSDYFKKYIYRIFKDENTIEAESMKYKQLIDLLNKKDINNKDANIIDLGGCHGFLSYLLTQYTENQIIMLEPFEESVNNCKKIWPSIIDDKIEFINGNYEKFISLKNKKSKQKITHIMSYDVIEHVGDIENFINLEETIAQRNNTKFIHATSANPYNLRNRIRDIKLQLKYEYFGNKNKSMKSSSSFESYFYLRFNRYNKYQKKYTKNNNISIIKSTIFAFLTRGLTKKEFELSLSSNFLKLLFYYLKNLNKIGIFNSIDLQNDSWMERHHNLNYLKKIIKKSNFKNIRINPTKYIYTNKSNLQNNIKKIINFLIDLIPINKGKLLLSPAIIITYNN